MANLLQPLGSFNDRYYRVKSPWNRALNDLRYAINGPLLNGEQGFTGKNISWRYFELKNPPKKSTYIQGQDINDINSFVDYEDVQASIQNLVNNVENSYGKSRNDNTGYEYLITFFQTLKEEAFSAEASLYNSLISNTQYAGTRYQTLVDNTNGTAEIKNDIDINTSIGFWTRALYNVLNDNGESKQISYKDAFAIIIASTDFYKKLKGGTRNTFYPSMFTRHGAYRAMLEENNKNSQEIRSIEKRMNSLTDKLDRASLEYLYEQFNDNIFNLFNNNENITKLEQDFVDIVRQKMDKIMSTYFHTNKKGKPIMSQLKQSKKNVSATQASSLIREKLTEKIRELLKDERFSGQINLRDSFVLESEISKEVYFSLEIEPAAKNKLYESARNFKGKDTDIVQHILNTLKLHIQNFFPENKDYICLKNLKIYYNNISISEDSKLTGLSGLKEGAIRFIEQGRIRNYLNTIYQKRTYWKEFKVANNNAFLSGFLGELAGEFLSLNLLKGNLDKAMLSGSAFSIFNKNKTYSVNDLKLIQKEKVNGKISSYNFGINVKHYIYNQNGTFSLYDKEDSLSIYNPYIVKYFGMHDVQLLRFIVENSGYFKSYQSTLRFAARSLAMQHLPELIRIRDYSKNTHDNLFFLINNILYPTTYIYDTILSQLKVWANGQRTSLKNFINITQKGTKEQKASYENIEEARQNWKEKDYELRKLNSSPSGQDLLIESKGLKINLVNLSLFN